MSLVLREIRLIIEVLLYAAKTRYEDFTNEKVSKLDNISSKQLDNREFLVYYSFNNGQVTGDPYD